jgi:hypothetical protein
MDRRLLLLVLAPLLIVAALEHAFRLGLYEPLAKPASHAGTSALLRRALADPRMRRIDTVTIGSSRAVYGIDHAALAAAAERRGLVHANLSMPGTHWMSVGVLTDWLAREHPEVRGGVIALADVNFTYKSNGPYEIGIATPFRSWVDRAWIELHVEAERGELQTYGVFSALMAYREDVQDLVAHPRRRFADIAAWRREDLVANLRTNVDENRDLCATPADTIDECVKLVEAPPDPEPPVVGQCRLALATRAAPRMDYGAMMKAGLPPHMVELRELIRAQLRALKWPKPPVIVLMPVHEIWRQQLAPVGVHEWALEVLRPLVEEGRIVVLDHSEDFIHDGRSDCDAFFDQFHQNSRGRARLAETLGPEIERALYDGAPSR